MKLHEGYESVDVEREPKALVLFITNNLCKNDSPNGELNFLSNRHRKLLYESVVLLLQVYKQLP